MIEVKNITKYFGDVAAVDNVSLSFEKNKIYGLLGRNGAGKTTLLNIITNRIFATGGSVTINGLEAEENDFAQEQVFFMTEKHTYPLELTVSEAIRWCGGFYPQFNKNCANELCEKFDLSPKKRVKSLSTGYKSILKLILTLSSEAPVMIFDEPVLGLDANYRELFYKLLIKRYEELENTMIISTHLIEEISSVIEHVIIIDKGRIIQNSDAEEIKKSAYSVSGAAEKVLRFAAGKKIIGTEKLGGYLSATLSGIPSAEEKAFIKKEGLEISAPGLQQIYISLTRKEGEENV